MHKRTSDRQPLLLATREPLGPLAGLVGQADGRQHVIRLLARDAVQRREGVDLFAGRQPLEER